MEGFTKEHADAVTKVIEAKWQERFSSGNINTDISNFVNGLKAELIADVHALAKPKNLGPTNEQVGGHVEDLGMHPLDEDKK